MVSRVRVWLNRTYAENVFFMDQLRRNPCGRAVEIHATHGDPDSPILAAADTALARSGDYETAHFADMDLTGVQADGARFVETPWTSPTRGCGTPCSTTCGCSPHA